MRGRGFATRDCAHLVGCRQQSLFRRCSTWLSPFAHRALQHGREPIMSAPGSSCVDAQLNPRAAPPFEEREDAWAAALTSAVEDGPEGRIPAWACGGAQ